MIAACQTPALDSLKIVLGTLSRSESSLAQDTAKVLILCELGRGKDVNGLVVGDYNQCIKWLQEAEQISQRHKWNKGLMLSNLYAGVWYAWKGDLLKGLQKKQKALYFAEVANDPYWLGIVCRHLGDHHYLLRNYDQAIFYLKKAISFSQKTHQIVYLLANQNLGIAYLEKNDYENANYWLAKAYSLCRQAKNQQLLKYVILNWAEVCLITNQKEKLDQLFKEYTGVTFEDRAWDVHYYGLSARRYLAENKPAIALKELKTGLQNLAIATDQHKQELLLQLSYAYEALGNANLSLHYYKKYNDLWETDVKSFQQKQIEYIRYEYENRKQEEAIGQLNQDVRQQKQVRNLLWIAVALALSFTVFLTWSNYTRSRKNKLIENQRNELLVLQEQLSISNQQLVHFNEVLEQKVSERTRDLVAANDQLTRKNLEIQDAFVNGKTVERKRVASELHDNLGSTISGLIWQLQSVMPENLLPKESEIYNGLVKQMRNAYNEIRHISHHLYPTELERGLGAALNRLITDLNNNRQIRFHLRGDYRKNYLTKEQEIELYSICLELINNTLKHSESNECMLEFVHHPHSIELIVRDNGNGFDPAKSKNRGRGLANIQERVESQKGTLTIESGAGTGAVFRIEFPVTGQPGTDHTA